MKKFILILLSIFLLTPLFATPSKEIDQDHFIGFGSGYNFYKIDPNNTNSNMTLFHGPSIHLKGYDTLNANKDISLFYNFAIFIPIDIITNTGSILDSTSTNIINFITGISYQRSISNNSFYYMGIGFHSNQKHTNSKDFYLSTLELGVGTTLGIQSKINNNLYLDIGLDSAIDFFERTNLLDYSGITIELTKNYFAMGASLTFTLTYQIEPMVIL